MIKKSSRQKIGKIKAEIFNKKTDFHEKALKNSIKEAQRNADYKILINEHYASVKTSRMLFAELKNAGEFVDGIYKTIQNMKTVRNSIYQKLNIEKSYSVRCELFRQLKRLKDSINKMYQDFHKMRDEKKHLYESLRAMNNKTHQLKCAIRDNCGFCGENWYRRLEMRRA